LDFLAGTGVGVGAADVGRDGAGADIIITGSDKDIIVFS
jgi:hypothetical protein